MKTALGGDTLDPVVVLHDQLRRYSRTLPLISDRERIAAARYAAEKLAIRLALLAQREKLLWSHYADGSGGIISVNQ